MLTEQEYAIVADNGIAPNMYTVNFSLVNSKAYHDKFTGLSPHRAVNEALYKQATKMLEHRSGTEYEDIVMLDSRTGVLLMANATASGANKFRAGLTYEQSVLLRELNRSFEILHNHPSSTLPSMADIAGLFDRRLAVASTIVGHDGTVYRMTKLRQYPAIEIFLRSVREGVKVERPDWPARILEINAVNVAITTLTNQHYLHYQRR